MYILRSDIHCIKYATIRAAFDPYFPVYDSVFKRGKYGYDSVQIRRNRDRRKPVFQYILVVIRKKLLGSD